MNRTTGWRTYLPVLVVMLANRGATICDHANLLPGKELHGPKLKASIALCDCQIPITDSNSEKIVDYLRGLTAV